MGWLVARLWERLTSRLVVMAVVITTITVGLLPAWNVHLVPESVRRVVHFRFSWPYRTEYEMWERNFINIFEDRKEEALALKARFKPGDSIVAGGIGVLGYYSGMHVYDRYGLVDRRVTMLLRQPSHLASPGHDGKVSTDFFLADEPIIVLHGRIDGSPPDQRTKNSLLRRVRMKAASWRKFSIWRRYVPEILPLKPSPDGSPNVLMVLRLIEEEPRVATLPHPERVATRTKRAEKAWNYFFAGLDSALLSDISFAYFEGGDIGGKVLAQAELWRTLLQPSLWRSYVPGLVELVGRPEPEAHHVMMVLRLIEEAPGDPIAALPRPARRRARAARATEMWEAFFARARALSVEDPDP